VKGPFQARISCLKGSLSDWARVSVQMVVDEGSRKDSSRAVCEEPPEMALNIWNRRWWWSYRVLRCASACLFVMVLLARPASPTKKEILGWVEHVRVGKSRLELTAKLDTGADTSSLDATKIRRFRGKDGERWVEFLVEEDKTGRRVRFKKRRVRTAYIKEHKGPSQKRSVVLMEICLGEYLQEVEVTLVDRSDFVHPVLLGRSALEGLAVVDPALTMTKEPRCPVEEKE